MAWRSSEVAYNMRQSSADSRERSKAAVIPIDRKVPDPAARRRMITDVVLEQELEDIGERLGEDIVSHCEDEKGNLNLRNLTGEQAMKFMSTMNLRMGRE